MPIAGHSPCGQSALDVNTVPDRTLNPQRLATPQEREAGNHCLQRNPRSAMPKPALPPCWLAMTLILVPCCRHPSLPGVPPFPPTIVPTLTSTPRFPLRPIGVHLIPRPSMTAPL